MRRIAVQRFTNHDSGFWILAAGSAEHASHDRAVAAQRLIGEVHAIGSAVDPLPGSAQREYAVGVLGAAGGVDLSDVLIEPATGQRKDDSERERVAAVHG